MLGNILRKLRKKQRWSQEVLAEKLDVSRQTIHKWESGYTNPNLQNIILISKVFKVTIDDLIK